MSSTGGHGQRRLEAGERLYFLHLARTGGSSLTRLLEDSFAAGARWPGSHLDEFSATDHRDLLRYRLFCGHLGTRPFEFLEPPLRAVTVLRDPVARAWSHFHAARRVHPAVAARFPGSGDGFVEFLSDDWYGYVAANFQAHWLAISPVRDVRSATAPGLALAHPFGPGRSAMPDDELLARARATLDRCDIVASTPRLAEVVAILSRAMGTTLPPPPRINADAPQEPIPAQAAAIVAERSQVDAELVRLAAERLDGMRCALPPLEPEPRASLPYRMSMAESLAGTGWHGRVWHESVGWHRWTGPGFPATVRLPVRLEGRAQLEVALVGVSHERVLSTMEVQVQDRRVLHRAEGSLPACTIVAPCRLRADEPATVTIVVPHPRPLVPGGEAAGVAVAAVGFSAAPWNGR